MQKNANIYHNLGYWFLSLVVLVFAGFYTTYFSVFFQPKPAVIHIHFALMVLWIAMLIAQPFLIKFKKRSLHRLVGKMSYIVVPLVLLFSFLMIRMGYYRYVNELQEQGAKGLNHFTNTEILRQAADGPIAIFYLSWFALFYIMSIVNSRKSSVHARYMVATALTLLGPTVDRIIMIPLKTESIGFIPAYAIAFLIADIVLVILLVKDYRAKKPIKALATCLAIYITGQALYFIVPHFAWWPDFMAFIMKPVP
jgi:hypothetical protein